MMKTGLFSFIVITICALTFYPFEVQAQMGSGTTHRGHRGNGMGPGMMGGGDGMGRGMMRDWITVPDSLPTPKNTAWIQKLREILVLEKKSYDQYATDAEKYDAAMPYMMVIPQEKDHINLIERMFEAYRLKSGRKHEPVEKTKNLKEAFEVCVRMEEALIPRYTWLVRNAEDRDSAQILNKILLQTRWHLAMFQHALGMGGRGMMMGGRVTE